MNVCYHYIKASTIYEALTATCSWHALIQSRQLQGEPIFPSSEPEPEAERRACPESHGLKEAEVEIPTKQEDSRVHVFIQYCTLPMYLPQTFLP